MVQSWPSPTHSPHSSTKAAYNQDMPWKFFDELLFKELASLLTGIPGHRRLRERVHWDRLMISKSW